MYDIIQKKAVIPGIGATWDQIKVGSFQRESKIKKIGLFSLRVNIKLIRVTKKRNYYL